MALRGLAKLETLIVGGGDQPISLLAYLLIRMPLLPRLTYLEVIHGHRFSPEDHEERPNVDVSHLERCLPSLRYMMLPEFDHTTAPEYAQIKEEIRETGRARGFVLTFLTLESMCLSSGFNKRTGLADS